jgi:L-malate glycosyltransferase
MKLAIVSLMSGQQWGGSESLWYALALHALHNKDEVLVSTYKWEIENSRLHLLQQNGATLSLRKLFNSNAGLVEKISRAIKKRNPVVDKDYMDIIHFKPDHVFISQGNNFDLAIHHLPLYKLLKDNNIAYSFVCHAHSQYSDIPSAAIYPNAIKIFDDAKHVFFISKKQQQLTERKLVKKLANAHFTWNPLAMKIPDRSYDWPETSVVQFAMVGAMVGGKGHDTMLEVFSQEEWKNRDWVLNIYGAGEGEAYLKALSIFYGLYKKIIFHGYANDIGSIWQQNHLLLMPSGSEGMPISLIEAMVCGRAAVASNVGGISELIIDTKNGFISEAPSVQSFANALESAWAQQGKWQEIGAHAREGILKIVDVHPEESLYKIICTL